MHDYAIVGAGVAGCVIAARLSADPAVRVLLIEGGPDLKPGALPTDVRSLFPIAAFNPSYTSSVPVRYALGGVRQPYVQGHGVGGTGTIMGMMALRGHPDDYDAWADLGATGWSWNDVLPYFLKLESDLDFAGPLHGENGPLPIRREAREDWPAFAKSFSGAFDRLAPARQWRYIEDLNADFEDGHGPLPISRSAEGRASAGISYLTSTVRARRNLEIRANTNVQRVIVNGDCNGESGELPRAVGLLLQDAEGVSYEAPARQILVTAGALRTPAILMRSGIGPGEALQRAGIAVRMHHAGVGVNLQTHALFYTFGFLRRLFQERRLDWPLAASHLRWSSGEQTRGDMALYIRGGLAPNPLGRRLSCLAAVLNKPLSRGTVTLDSHAPESAIDVSFNLLSNECDLNRMENAVRIAAEFYSNMPDAVRRAYAFRTANDLARAMATNRRTKINSLLCSSAASLLSCGAGAGEGLVARISNMSPLSRLLVNRDSLRNAILNASVATGHICGTARMGRRSDPMSVVDEVGRIHGILGLRVADASVMPSVPSANTHVPVVMVAEKIAEAIRADRQSEG